MLHSKRCGRFGYSPLIRCAALAAVGATLLGGPALAGIRYYYGNISVPLDFDQPLDLNFENDDYDDVVFENYLYDGVAYQGVTVPYSPGRLVGFAEADVQYATAVPPGAMIDSSTLGGSYFGALAYGDEYPQAQFASAQDAFVGLAFPVGPTELHYAWVRVAVDNAAGTLLVKDWAFEDQPGVGIVAGDQGDLPIYGDFNDDRSVDGADLLAWQRGFPTTYTVFDLWKWSDNFGAGAGLSAASALGTVPEPPGVALLAAGSLLAAARRRRQPRRGNAAKDSMPAKIRNILSQSHGDYGEDFLRSA